MKKSIPTILLVIALCVALVSPIVSASAAFTESVKAIPSPQAVFVNGQNIAFDIYNIGGYNYFKLRDMAYALNGTQRQFSIWYDEALEIVCLDTGCGYTPVGGEMSGKSAFEKSANATSQRVFLNGQEVNLAAYNIDGNNYFRLHNLGQALDFHVSYDSAANAVVIDTSKGYKPEENRWEWDGVLEAGTLLIGDSLTYHLIAQYLRPKGLLGQSSYITMCSTDLRHYFSDGWTLQGNGYLCNPEFYGMPFYRAVERSAGRFTSVFFLLGSNGSSSVTQRAYEETLDHLLAAYPAATIYIQTVPYSAKGVVNSEWVNFCVRAAVNAYHERGITRVVMLDTYSIWDASCMTYDTVHLTEEGNKRWYELIVETLS